MSKMVYLIGSLRNPAIADIASNLEAELNALRLGPPVEVFASWAGAGPEADDHWKAYETARGRDYKGALASHAAEHIFAFDKKFLDRADAVVLILPAGRSGHLELGYAIGTGKPGFIVLDDPDRWDVMYRFATAVIPWDSELLAVTVADALWPGWRHPDEGTENGG